MLKMSSFKCSKGFGTSADIFRNVRKVFGNLQKSREISRNPSHDKVKTSRI